MQNTTQQYVKRYWNNIMKYREYNSFFAFVIYYTRDIYCAYSSGIKERKHFSIWKISTKRQCSIDRDTPKTLTNRSWNFPNVPRLEKLLISNKRGNLILVGLNCLKTFETEILPVRHYRDLGFKRTLRREAATCWNTTITKTNNTRSSQYTFIQWSECLSASLT